MAQLAAVQNLLYYPTPIEEIGLFAKHLWLSHERYRAFDPCCGEGIALEYLVKHLGRGQGETYGVEIAVERAMQAAGRLNVCINAPFEEIVCLNPPDLVFMNPPYDEVNGQRVELTWINEVAAQMRNGSHMILVLPDKFFAGGEWHDKFRATLWKSHLALVTKGNYDYSRTNLFHGLRMTDANFPQFKQVFLLVQKTSYAILEKEIRIEGTVGEKSSPIVTLETGPGWRRDWDWERVKPDEKFMIAKVPPIEAKSVMNDRKHFVDVFGPLNENITVNPLMPMRMEIVAAVVAGGMFSGIQLGDEIVRGGITIRDEIHVIEDESAGTKEEITTHVMVANLSVRNVTSKEIHTYNSDDPEFGKRIEHVAHLVAEKLSTDNPSIFRGQADIEKYHHLYKDIHAPRKVKGAQNGLLPPQVEKVAIALTAWEKMRNVILIGEPGVGKTVTSVAAAVAQVRNRKSDAQKIVILIPSKNDLKNKWIEEIDMSCRDLPHETVEVSTITDVQKAFATPGLVFIVVKESMAKRTSGWEHTPRVHGVVPPLHELPGTPEKKNKGIGVVNPNASPEERRLKRIERVKELLKDLAKVKSEKLEPRHHDMKARFEKELQFLETRDKPWSSVEATGVCHKCGKKVQEWVNSEKELVETDAEFRYCPHCGEKQWSMRRDHNGNAYASIAKYISRHYAGNYVLIMDEAHQYKGGETARGYAAHHLSKGAKRGLVMTGTFYNGFASSMFYTLHRTQGWFRKTWGPNDVNDFVRAYGLEQEIVKLRKKSTSGSWSGYNVSRTAITKEIPGIHPSMIAMMLHCLIFMKLEEFAVSIPRQTGETLFLDMDPGHKAKVDHWLESVLQQAVDEMKDKDNKSMSLMGQFQWANRGTHDIYPMGDSVTMASGRPMTLPPIDIAMTPKEEAIVRLVLAEKRRGYPVLLYHLQTERRPWQDRLGIIFQKYGLNLCYMPSSVNERVPYVRKAIKEGADAVLCNPNIVREGIDLLEFKMMIWISVTDDAILVTQANARNHRIGQDQETRVIYIGYNETYQSDRWKVTAEKVAAMAAMHGDVRQGLAAILGEKNLIVQLQETMIKYDRAASDLSMDDLPPLVAWTPAEADNPSTEEAPIPVETVIAVDLPKPEPVFVPKNDGWTGQGEQLGFSGW